MCAIRQSCRCALCRLRPLLSTSANQQDTKLRLVTSMRQAINRSRALTTPENHLIELLSHKDRARLLAIAETVPLAISQVLCKPGDTASHVYFPFHGFVSLVSLTEHGKGVEVGMIGREGMLGSHVALGVARSPLHGLVQGEGKARRIAVSEFRNELG